MIICLVFQNADSVHIQTVTLINYLWNDGLSGVNENLETVSSLLLLHFSNIPMIHKMENNPSKPLAREYNNIGISTAFFPWEVEISLVYVLLILMLVGLIMWVLLLMLLSAMLWVLVSNPLTVAPSMIPLFEICTSLLCVTLIKSFVMSVLLRVPLVISMNNIPKVEVYHNLGNFLCQNISNTIFIQIKEGLILMPGPK